jgi:hypothetical protein
MSAGIYGLLSLLAGIVFFWGVVSWVLAAFFLRSGQARRKALVFYFVIILVAIGAIVALNVATDWVLWPFKY